MESQLDSQLKSQLESQLDPQLASQVQAKAPLSDASNEDVTSSQNEEEKEKEEDVVDVDDDDDDDDDDDTGFRLAYLDESTPLIDCVDPPRFVKLLKRANPPVFLFTKLLNNEQKQGGFKPQASSSSSSDVATFDLDDDSIFEMITTLNSLGFKDPLIGHFIYACSFETLVIVNYITQFLDSLSRKVFASDKKLTFKDKKTKNTRKKAKDEIKAAIEGFDWDTELVYAYLPPPRNEPVGAWNKLFDAILDTLQESKLHKFKSGQEIEQRKKFIASCLEETEEEEEEEEDE